MQSSKQTAKRPTGPRQSRDEEATSGSSEPEFLIVGKIVRPHGVRGEIGMKLMTDHTEHLLQVTTLYIGPEHRAYGVKRMRRHQTGMIIHFDSFTDRDMAELLREQLVYVHVDDAVPLEDGEYYLFQIEGIQVVTEDGETLGHLSGLLETGANDVYIVATPDGGELLLPVIPEVIKNVNVPDGIMTVHLLEGLR